ncbi:MAG: two component transcriptional regulator, winged helix family [Acidimicrobiaceae bacterium]|nr:two component transcriptional regulator, winged helix family [Acidimicrobiaceae bacterium]
MRILIVEDEPEMRELLGQLLEADGYEVETVSDSAGALAAVAVREPDLVLLDVVLGGEDGRDLLHELRLMGNAPAVFLTGRGLEMDRIAGLRMGADDYIVKPFSPGELSARIANVLRRSRATNVQPRQSESSVSFGDLRIDPLTREVERAGELVELTAKEFDLLAFLASSPRQVFSRQQLLQQVWSSCREWQDEATVTEHIRRVRRKIEQDPDHPRWITTVRGVGYRFEPGAGSPIGYDRRRHLVRAS